MATTNRVSRKEVPYARQRLPGRAKGRSGNPIMDIEVTGLEPTERNVNIPKHQPNGSNSDSKTFEFVTLTSEPTTTRLREISKIVRKQAMHDYLRKQNRQAASGIVEVVESTKVEEPSRYTSKFKLDTWSHKTKTKAIIARRAKESDQAAPTVQEELIPTNDSTSSGELPIVGAWRPIERDAQFQRFFSPSASALDPFNTLAIRLDTHSKKLLVHCI